MKTGPSAAARLAVDTSRVKSRLETVWTGMGLFSADQLFVRHDKRDDALKNAGCERIYQDVASGAKTARPALDALLGQLRAGDRVVIWKLDHSPRPIFSRLTVPLLAGPRAVVRCGEAPPMMVR